MYDGIAILDPERDAESRADMQNPSTTSSSSVAAAATPSENRDPTIAYIELHDKDKSLVDYALVDKEDEARVTAAGPWHVDCNGYPRSHTAIALHNFILPPLEGKQADHIFQRKLDNRKSQLRYASASLNSQNKRKRENTASKYLGVHWDAEKGKWRAGSSFGQEGRRKTIGIYDDEEEAAYAYNNVFVRKVDPEAKINEGVGDFPNIKFSQPLAMKGYSKSSTGKFTVSVMVFGVSHQKTVKTEEEAKALVNELRQEREVKRARLREEKAQIRIEGPVAYCQVPYHSSDEIATVIIDSDEKTLNLFKSQSWSINSNGYPFGNNIALHQLIFGECQPKHYIDHVNRNKFDARKSNLREASGSLQGHNKSKQKNTSSSYIGVCKETGAKKFRAYIKQDNVTHRLGCFDSQEDAARARDKKAIELFGRENARLNFPDSVSSNIQPSVAIVE